MKGKLIIGAAAVGAILGSAAVISIVPCCLSSHNRKKFLKYKNHMFKTVGTVLDTMADFKRM